MATFMTPEDRIKHLEESCRRVGGKAELGRRLGYKDGAYIGQMLTGLRPITEKTIHKLLEMRELKGLWAFDATGSGFDLAKTSTTPAAPGSQDEPLQPSERKEAGMDISRTLITPENRMLFRRDFTRKVEDSILRCLQSAIPDDCVIAQQARGAYNADAVIEDKETGEVVMNIHIMLSRNLSPVNFETPSMRRQPRGRFSVADKLPHYLGFVWMAKHETMLPSLLIIADAISELESKQTSFFDLDIPFNLSSTLRMALHKGLLHNVLLVDVVVKEGDMRSTSPTPLEAKILDTHLSDGKNLKSDIDEFVDYLKIMPPWQ